MQERVFDLESDGLNPTKIHCIGVCPSSDVPVKATANYANMRKFFTNPDNILIAHNCMRYDIPVVERLLDIKVEAQIVDTLACLLYTSPSPRDS